MMVILCAALLVQDKTAEETFKKIEEQIEKAKAVSLKFKCDVVTWSKISKKKEESTFSGTLLLKERDKLQLTLKSSISGKEETRIIVSDGQTRRFRWGEGGNGQGGEVKGIQDEHAMDFARIGVFRMLDLLDYRLEKKPGDAQIRVSEFGWGEVREDTKTLTYKFKFPGMDVTGEGKLVYDPKTYKPIRRTISFETAPLGTSTIATDTYEELIFNADVPDEKFKLPEK